ncbi:MAG: OmpA family protein [Rhodospirillaceae bacterium]|nr:OmpA family protein [Rhodospirillaceae bacterium]
MPPCVTNSRQYSSALRMVAVASLFTLTACSSLPDAVNPVEWYRGASDSVGGWFSDDDAAATAPAAPESKAKSSDEGSGWSLFPSLSRVPDKPATVNSDQDRASIRKGLIADRANARYADRSKLPSQRLDKGKSSLWPNVPPPNSGGDQAKTSADVGGSRAQAAATGNTNSVAPAPVTSVIAGASSESSVAAVPPTAPPAPIATPPAAAPTPIAVAAPSMAPTPVAAATGVTVPQMAADTGRIVLTPPAGMTPSDQSVVSNLSVLNDNSSLFGTSSAGAQMGDGQGGAVPGAAGFVPVPGSSYQVAAVRFAHGSARLSAKDRRALSRVVQVARESGGRVRVIGHASSRTRDMDPVQHQIVNFNMSVVRANQVAAVLTKLGVSPESLFVDAVGDTQPMVAEVMPRFEAENRRTEIFIDY